MAAWLAGVVDRPRTARTPAPGDSDPMLRTQNLHVVKTEPLVAPRVIKRELPGSDALYEVVVRARATIRDIIAGRDRRLLAVVGPCSIHDPEAALDYAGRLGALAGRLADERFGVLRGC